MAVRNVMPQSPMSGLGTMNGKGTKTMPQRRKGRSRRLRRRRTNNRSNEAAKCQENAAVPARAFPAIVSAARGPLQACAAAGSRVRNPAHVANMVRPIIRRLTTFGVDRRASSQPTAATLRHVACGNFNTGGMIALGCATRSARWLPASGVVGCGNWGRNRTGCSRMPSPREGAPHPDADWRLPQVTNITQLC